MSRPQLLTISVGVPQTREWRDGTVTSGIWKEPVEGPVRVGTLDLEGDGQADLTVHGGVDKAVYVYPFEHYDFWRSELPGRELPHGSFGENLTIAGIDEQSARIGDRMRIGSAEFEVSQPRMPCYKLGVKFDDPGMVKRFLVSRRSGFYFRVQQEGMIEAGQPIEFTHRGDERLTVRTIVDLWVSRKTADPELLQLAARCEALPLEWREQFRG